MSRLLTRSLVVLVPVLAYLTVGLQEKATIVGGVGRTIVGLNNEDCFELPELVAREHAWVHQPSGLAYLGCFSRFTRSHWTPCSLSLNATSLPPLSPDSIFTYSFSTHRVTLLTLTNFPPSFPGIYTHSFDAFPSSIQNAPEGLRMYTFYFISHRPPLVREDAGREGADSVVEVFDGVLGAGSLKWVKNG